MGIAGMPRRISDYPDSFAGLNYIASLGSMISVAASLVFFYLILDALLQQKRSSATAPWSATSARQAYTLPDHPSGFAVEAVIALLCVIGGCTVLN